MKLKFRIVTLIVAMFTFVGVGLAQSAQEIEMAKKMAKSYGYSDAEINAMMGKKDGGAAGQKAGATKKIERVPAQGANMTGQEGMEGDMAFMNILMSAQAIDSTKIVFGHEIFKSPNLNFIPSYNMPTPESYKISAGDELVLDIWGAVYLNITQDVSPEGSITIPDVGPIYLNGLTIAQAEARLKSHLSGFYSGMGGKNPNTFLRVSLGKIRSFSINVVGDAEKPGTYTLPSLSNVFSALYLAGGPKEIGSVRDIRLYRNNKLYKTFDVYDFIVGGDFTSNVRLEDNDLIVVRPYVNKVSMKGAVKREMNYEMVEGETVKDLLKYCGGFSKDAIDKHVVVTRVKGDKRQSFNVLAAEFASFKLEDGDEIVVSSNADRNKNKVIISGGVWTPGTYAISESVMTLKQLIDFAGGLLPEAYNERGYIERFSSANDTIAVNFSVKNVMAGTEEVLLNNRDRVVIFTNPELVNRTKINTYGELNSPGDFVFRPGMTLGDVILLSDGYTVGAAISNIDVARRNFNDGSKSESDTVSTVFNFDLLANPEDENFELAPYDMVFVRVAPNYKKQTMVSVAGEVIFPGNYVVEKNVVRVSDIIKKAGGFNQDAFVEGAVIQRRLTEEEILKATKAMEFAKEKMQDSLAIGSLDEMDLTESFTVGIDMQKAVSHPGSYADVILRPGDVINIPKMNNTVKISGGVLFTNVVAYDPDMSVKDYIDMAGGYVKGARKYDTYIVYMNGTLTRRGSKMGMKVRPGAEIVVPVKDLKNRNRISAGEIMSLASSTASIATMVVSMVNLLSK